MTPEEIEGWTQYVTPPPVSIELKQPLPDNIFKGSLIQIKDHVLRVVELSADRRTITVRTA